VPTAFLTHSLFPRHEMPPGHPECAQRISAITDELITQGIYDLLRVVEAPAATREALCRVHSESHVSMLEAIEPGDGLVALDPDTFAGPHSVPAALHAAGAAVEATDMVVRGEANNAFCCVRPPGHHAERARAMGFCLLNSVAVGAAHALAGHGLERVAILDFDVHHGNGTEDIFAGDERVLFCSSFQHPFYPGTAPSPKGTNVVRAMLAAGSDGTAFQDAITEQWGPAIADFRPEMIFVSAGFDAHIEDAMSGVRLVDDDYRWVSDWITSVADAHADGRIVSCLEGGYALPALGRCATLHIRALAGLSIKLTG
jgi:acetoin utilization deacetylase AcuC-like enzyme